MKKDQWFKTKKITGLLSLTSLVAGFIFLKKKITGNMILNYYNSITAFSIIGLLLILCSIILAIYSIKKE